MPPTTVDMHWYIRRADPLTVLETRNTTAVPRYSVLLKVHLDRHMAHKLVEEVMESETLWIWHHMHQQRISCGLLRPDGAGMLNGQLHYVAKLALYITSLAAISLLVQIRSRG